MPGMQWILELVLVALLAVTLFHAVRLERSLGMLKRDRGMLEALAGSFNASTCQAEAGIDRLRAAADGAGLQLARQIEAARALKDDLTFLNQRGEHLADRLGAQARTGRAVPADVEATGAPRPRSQVERDLLKALRLAR